MHFQGFSQEKMDILAIPISGLFAASPKRALNELKSFSQPLPIIIPMHWLLRKNHLQAPLRPAQEHQRHAHQDRVERFEG